MLNKITKKENKTEENGGKSETADSGTAEMSSSSGISSEEEEEESEEEEGEEEEEGDGLVDLEDLGTVLSKGKKAASKSKSGEPKVFYNLFDFFHFRPD